MTSHISTASDDDNLIVRHVERATGDLRRGEPVRLRPLTGRELIFAAAEHAQAVIAMALKPGKTPLQLILQATRAVRLGYHTQMPISLTLEADASPSLIHALINPLEPTPRVRLPYREATAAEVTALRCIKLASLLPAALVIDVSALRAGLADELLTVSEEKLHRYAHAFASALEPVAQAHVPLLQAPNTKIIAFRPRFGVKEHLALIVGDPLQFPVPLVRLHSSCITGDMLESLRCDCGDQLRQSLHMMNGQGGGIVLYLTQEGRGIGIANKLRAYQLQDAGLDTIEANEALGFDADERHFEPAAEILKKLGATRIRLMTNNPRKVEALAHYGIEVVERVPLVIKAGSHNHTYLATKANRLGHLL